VLWFKVGGCRVGWVGEGGWVRGGGGDQTFGVGEKKQHTNKKKDRFVGGKGGRERGEPCLGGHGHGKHCVEKRQSTRLRGNGRWLGA